MGLAGILVIAVGEWIARRQLPPEMRSPEAIQYYFDGLVCLACGIWGSALIGAAILMASVLGLFWLFSELIHPRV